MPTVAHSIPRHVPGAPPGYRGPRGAILVELKRGAELTAPALAERLGLSLNAVRHHLRELESESLIEYVRQRQPVGAPVFVYRLTGIGEGLFPRRYEETLLDVLDRVAEHEGRAAAAAIVASRFDALADRLRPELEGLALPARLERIAAALHEDGYMAEASTSGGDAGLREHNCAIRAVAERFPEVCDAEARFLESLLGAPVERLAHILDGCGACEYKVRLTSARAG